LSKYNIRTDVHYGPGFGYQGYDLNIVSYSNKFATSSSDLGYSFQLPEGCTYGTQCSRNFFAGSYTGWLVTEIEVYQMTQPDVIDTS
jgi:hypothetical protein